MLGFGYGEVCFASTVNLIIFIRDEENSQIKLVLIAGIAFEIDASAAQHIKVNRENDLDRCKLNELEKMVNRIKDDDSQSP